MSQGVLSSEISLLNFYGNVSHQPVPAIQYHLFFQAAHSSLQNTENSG